MMRYESGLGLDGLLMSHLRRDNLAALRIQYDSEVERITQEELRKQKAKQRQIGVLQRWSAATSLVGSKLLEAQLESEGAAAVAPEVAT